MNARLASLFAAGLFATSLAAPVQAAAVHDSGLFTTVLPRNDDGSTGLVNIGFTLNFFGSNRTQLYVNNNGNVTFTQALSTFTPFPIVSNGLAMLAPFFADVDTRGAGSDVVRYGQSTIGGKSVFGVNWIGVGVFSQLPIYNSFQLIITDRSDVAAGDFDFEFNYDAINWETGTASGGNNQGRGGNSARAGWTNGVDTSYEFAGSAVNGALLDGGPNALIASSLNSNTLGQYIFRVRNGNVEPPQPAPEPGMLALLAVSFLGLAMVTRRRNNGSR